MTKSEQKAYHLGRLEGELETIAKFNSKTNHDYNFAIEEIPLLETVEASFAPSTDFISESFELTPIDPKVQFKVLCDLLHDTWFFAYQEEANYHLKDVNTHFVLSLEEEKKSWVEGFVDLLLHTLQPKQIYSIQYLKLKQYYCSDYDEFLLEADDALYYFRLTVVD